MKSVFSIAQFIVNQDAFWSRQFRRLPVHWRLRLLAPYAILKAWEYLGLRHKYNGLAWFTSDEGSGDYERPNMNQLVIDALPGRVSALFDLQEQEMLTKFKQYL
jgi:hypothetical protein